MEHPPQMKKAFASARFSGAAFVACLLIYLALVEFIKSRYRPFTGFVSLENTQTLRLVLFAAAAVLVVLNRILNGRLLKKGTGSGPDRAVQSLFRATLVSLTLAEAPALIGLALFFLGGLYKDFYVLLFVSLILVFMYFPRLKFWEDYLSNRPAACRF